MKKTIFLTLILCLPLLLLAQNTGNEGKMEENTTEQGIYGFKLIARSYGDSVVLRWAAENAGVWLLSNRYGWNVERSSDNPNDTVLDYLLNDKPLVPMSLKEMAVAFDSTNLMAGVAAQALYGQGVFNDIDEASDFTNFVFRRDQEQKQRQLLAYLAAESDPQVASALAMRYVDRNVRPNTFYEYTVTSLIPKQYAEMNGLSILVETRPFVRSEEESIPSVEVRQIDAYRAVVMCRRNLLSAYYFERSSDKGKNWEKLTKAPVYPNDPPEGTREAMGDSIAEWMYDYVLLLDSLELNKTYLYRATAFDAFGDYAPSRTSAPFQMMDLIPPTPPVLHTIIPKENKICTLTWDKEPVETDLKGYIVTFSEDIQGPWQRVSDLLGPKTTEYVDNEADKRGRGFYRILAADDKGNISYSAAVLNHIEDIICPDAPQGLRGVADISGYVYLDWLPNQEKDLRGYRVYFANQKDHDFIECSQGFLPENQFEDTIEVNTITPYIFYYVVAVDYNYNTSTSSDTLALRLPDTLVPGKVLLEKLTQDGNAVYAQWRKSASHDVISYFIYRKLQPAKHWECIYIASPDQVDENGILHFVDYPPYSDIAYNYCIEAMDDWQNTSGKNGQFTVYVSAPVEIAVDISLTATYNKNNNTVQLQWHYDYESDTEHYGVIYRSLNGEPAEDIVSFERGETSFTDRNVPEADNVSYYLQLVLGNGRHSTNSNIVKLNTRK